MPTPRFPPTQSTSYALGGGLDLVTPRLKLDPGKVFDSLNYEPRTVGGYRRLDGYECFDGRTKPSDADYWLIGIALTGSIAVGNTVTGATSAATGKVLALVGTTQLVLGRVTGTFQNAEVLNVGGTPRATTTSTATKNSAPDPSDNADYRLLAAADRRADILAVPGSGPIRGVWLYNDTVYAFRDNVGATAGTMWKSTTGGWVQITFGRELQFTAGSGQINVGDTVTGLTSGASGVAVAVLLRTGTWGGTGVGTIVFASVTGAFQNAENIQVGGVNRAVANGADTAITRAPGGRMEFVNANFSGSTATEKMYGVDGVNKCFEFNGTTYVPIRTGMTTDTPSHIAFHLSRLWLSFLGSLQNSSVGTPYGWTVVTGANEVSTGEGITGIKSQTGNSSTTSLTVTTRGKTHVLYGSTSGTFQLVPSNEKLGFRDFTLQSVGNDLFGQTPSGIQSLVTTLNYGDFEYATVSTLIQPLMDRKLELNACAVSLRSKSQYRIFFADNTGLIVGLTGEKPNGVMPVNYGRPVLCICAGSMSTGQEVCFFGSDDGYVYQDNVGTSFNGVAFQAWIRPAFNNLQSPLVRKQFRRAVFEVETEGYSVVNISYDLGYGNPNVSPPAIQEDTELVGAGDYWDQFTWDVFTWSAAYVEEASMQIDGTEKNIAFLFYSNRAQDDSHTVQAVTLLYTPRRLERA